MYWKGGNPPKIKGFIQNKAYNQKVASPYETTIIYQSTAYIEVDFSSETNLAQL